MHARKLCLLVLLGFLIEVESMFGSNDTNMARHHIYSRRQQNSGNYHQSYDNAAGSSHYDAAAFNNSGYTAYGNNNRQHHNGLLYHSMFGTNNNVPMPLTHMAGSSHYDAAASNNFEITLTAFRFVDLQMIYKYDLLLKIDSNSTVHVLKKNLKVRSTPTTRNIMIGDPVLYSRHGPIRDHMVIYDLENPDNSVFRENDKEYNIFIFPSCHKNKPQRYTDKIRNFLTNEINEVKRITMVGEITLNVIPFYKHSFQKPEVVKINDACTSGQLMYEVLMLMKRKKKNSMDITKGIKVHTSTGEEIIEKNRKIFLLNVKDGSNIYVISRAITDEKIADEISTYEAKHDNEWLSPSMFGSNNNVRMPLTNAAGSSHYDAGASNNFEITLTAFRFVRPLNYKYDLLLKIDSNSTVHVLKKKLKLRRTPTDKNVMFRNPVLYSRHGPIRDHMVIYDLKNPGNSVFGENDKEYNIFIFPKVHEDNNRPQRYSDKIHNFLTKEINEVKRITMVGEITLNVIPFYKHSFQKPKVVKIDDACNYGHLIHLVQQLMKRKKILMDITKGIKMHTSTGEKIIESSDMIILSNVKDGSNIFVFSSDIADEKIAYEILTYEAGEKKKQQEARSGYTPGYSQNDQWHFSDTDAFGLCNKKRKKTRKHNDPGASINLGLSLMTGSSYHNAAGPSKMAGSNDHDPDDLDLKL